MPSTLTKIIFLYFMIALMFKLMLPEAGIGTHLLARFVNTSSSQGLSLGSDINKTLPSKPSGILTSVNTYIAPIEMVWNFIAFGVDLLTMPLGVANYMIAKGAPMEAVLAALSPFIVLGVGAVADFIRSGG